MSRPARVVLLFIAVAAIAAQAVLEAPTYRRPFGGEPAVTIYWHGTGERGTLPMEEYVAGVVAAEMDPRWPVEALAAQAVIARTFAVERLARGGVRRAHGTDVCDDPGHFQAYDPEAITPGVRRAVARTRGLVLTYGGEVAQAFYHAHSGGYTATPGEGVDFRGAAPYLQARPDPYSGDAMRWKAWVTPAEVRAAARRMGVKLGRVLPAEVTARGPSGRAVTFRFGGKEVPAARFRLELDGGMRIRSTLIDGMEVSGGRLVITGRGFGHGVGLSQFGAMRMAQSGHDFRAILAFYYPGTVLERRWH
ncbi:MAG: SpoIID/LytB domain-containing protein [Bacillota bacterium]|nr:SpoIID/LytB domain-containing protein [Bacillota bacterium]